ncbi:MAG: hypothetical protein JXA74_13275 [Anaerolineae bacterium]|nr:hypothetical protein [Anaerolineae bacterium]
MSFQAKNEQALSLIRGYVDAGLDLDIQGFLLDCQIRNLFWPARRLGLSAWHAADA